MTREGMFSLAAAVLGRPGSLLDAGDDPETLGWMVPRLLAITAVGGALFGGVVGSYRGGVQLIFAAVKMPLLLLVPVVVCLPAIRALYASGGVPVSYGRVAVAGLVGMARTAVLAAALGPVLWLVYSLQVDYHLAILILAGSLALVGLPGLAVVARAIPVGARRRGVAMLGAVAVLGAALAQTGWLLRPFVARPTVAVAFLRPVEEDVASSLAATAASAVGAYPEWESAPSGFVGRTLDDGGER